MRVPISTGLLIAALAAAPVRPAEWADVEIYRAVDAVKARAGSIPEQARALTVLAWPDGEPTGDPRVRALARKQIVGFGDRGLDALRERLRAAPPRYAADITSALAETRLVVTAGLPAQFLPAMYDAVWFGPPEAKRLAMFELARFRYGPSLLPIIDAAYEYPRLLPTAIDSVAKLGDDRGRHFLGEVLLSGQPPHYADAAEALAKIGGRAIETLRDAAASPRVEVRGAAIDALIPVSRVEDLTILYEYLQRFAEEDDERRVELVMQRARQLESLLEANQYRDPDEEY